MIGHYGRSEAWPDAGYRGPWLGRAEIRVLRAPDLRADASPDPQATAATATSSRSTTVLSPGITEGSRVTRDLHLRTRVCVVGTGAGGCAALAALAAAGVEALAIEAGGYSMSVNSVHPQGSCAMNADPRQGATRPTGELWGADRIYVADASLFPTSVGVPPQVTVMALGMLVADRVCRRVA